MNARNTLIYLSMLYEGDSKLIYDHLTRKEPLPSDEEAQELLQKVTSPCITILDEDYPENLKQKVFCPPFVLYYYGDISLIKDEYRNIAFIGSRKCSVYGQNITQKIVSKVAKKYTIVSGLAKGIDTCAHAACINKLGKTIAVLGSGIDFCYPENNKKLYEIIKRKGLVISEYPGITPPSIKSFPMRNRIIVGLSRTVVITEAKKHSGTSISTAYALASGKDVCCIPYPVGTNSFCNKLIKDGAFLIESAKDLVEVLKHDKAGPVFEL